MAKRVLVYRLGSLGDTVVALPAFRFLKTAFPGARVTVLTNVPVSGKAAPLEAILEHTGLYDEVLNYPVGLRSVRQLRELHSQIRRRQFDFVVSLAAARGRLNSYRDYLFFKACGIPRIIGVPTRKRDLVCQSMHGTGLYESETARLMRRIAMIGTVDLNEPRWWDLSLLPEEMTRAKQLLDHGGIEGPYLSASVGTKVPAKDWGESNWRTLLQRVSSAYPELPLVLVGSSDEFGRSAALQEVWSGPSANLCGAITPRVTAAVLQRAALFLGHDSGPMHLAAAVGAPCVAIFSARNPPGQWFPHGCKNSILYPRLAFDKRRIDDFGYQRAAINSITVNAVWEAVKKQLDARSRGAWTKEPRL